jgi:formate hydrogenlyase transcriptional activator
LVDFNRQGRSMDPVLREKGTRGRAVTALHGAHAEIRDLKKHLQAGDPYLFQEINRTYSFGEVIGQSRCLENVFFRVEAVAPQDSTVLLLGETGTGKGLVARAIHSRSLRRHRPLLTVNCTALPANLIESELFGREKGAFTGASSQQLGRFELADKGTILLDEIGDLPFELQAKLLQVIQEGEFSRLGSARTVKVDVRIIAATNRDLYEEIRLGRFREDLFYRLNIFPITVPPLRDRKEDIPLLVDYFLDKFNRKLGKNVRMVTNGTMSGLMAHTWPGNVRELESVIERAVIISRGSTLQVLDEFDAPHASGQRDEAVPLVEMERDYISQVLQRTHWRIEGSQGAARILGINPSTLRGRMRKEGIHRP